MRAAFVALITLGCCLNLQLAASQTVSASNEATIQGGASADIDIAESDAGYLHLKYHVGLTSARKVYFQFDLSAFDPDLEKPATFTVYFKNSYLQRAQLWALTQPYTGFDSHITWNNAQANELHSNRLLTNGMFSARAIGESILLPASGTTPHGFVIPRLADFIFGKKVTLVLASEEDVSNNASGLRLLTNAASLVFSLSTNSHEAPAFDVYLIGGQSNQDGRGYTSELTGTNNHFAQPQTNVLIYYANPVNENSTNPTYNTGWQTLAPGFSVPPNFSGALPSPRFGPEISFAKSLTSLNPHRRLAFIKVTQSGTSLSSDWRPSTGYMYATLTNTVRVALQDLRTRGAVCTLRGMIWHQGESDSSGSAATNYQTNLTQLIQAVRRDVGVANLPFVVGEIATNKTEAVRNAQFNVAQNIPYVGFASADALLTGDGTHFTSEGVLLLGARFAAALEVPPLRIEQANLSEGNLLLQVGGLALSSFQLRASLSVFAPRSEWALLNDGMIDGSGGTQVSVPMSSSTSFYILESK